MSFYHVDWANTSTTEDLNERPATVRELIEACQTRLSPSAKAVFQKRLERAGELSDEVLNRRTQLIILKSESHFRFNGNDMPRITAALVRAEAFKSKRLLP